MLNLKFQASLRSQLMVMLLAVSVSAMLAIAYLCYHSGETNLTNRIFSQLTSVRASKADQIQAYFESIRDQTQTLSEDLMIVNAIKEFETAYHQLETKPIPAEWDAAIGTYYQQDYLPKLAKLNQGTPIPELYQPTAIAAQYLQYHYIAANPNPVGKKHLLDDPGDGSSYSQVHALYHPILKKFHDRFGYYDLFLIDPDSGAIVYSIFKEVDYGTSLFTGPYHNSNLAKAVAAAIEAKGTGYTKIVDFDQYKPSYGAPAGFIAAPIFDHSSFIGVLALQFPVDEINQVMTGHKNWKKDGLGHSGETYIVGQDHTMRSVSRFLVEEPDRYLELLQNIHVNEDTIDAIKRFGTSILQQEVNTVAVQEALAQREGTRIVKDYRGVPVLSSYAPLDIQGLNWTILSEMDLAEAYAPVYAFQRVILIWATFIILLITVASMVLSYVFIKPINTLITSARKIGEGEVDALVTLNSQDEFGELADAFNDMVHTLRAKTEMIEQKNRENEELLLNIFPASIAKRLKSGEKDIADQVPNVTVLFVDVTGFTGLSESMTVYEAVKTLNDLVTTFDEATERFGVEKIKTSGDNYMAVCGLSSPRLDHMNRMIDFAIEVRSLIRRFNYEKGCALDVKISIHSGDVIAGIVGRKKLIYDVWGDTVNVANIILSRSPSVPGSIMVSQTVYDYLQDLYDFEWVDNLDQHSDPVMGVWHLKSAGKRGGRLMNLDIWQDSLLNWALTLAIGFPLVELILGEVIHTLKQQGNPLISTLRIVRNLLIPTLVLLLFLTYILQLNADGKVIKFVETLFWICTIHASLSLVNVVVFTETGSDSETWQSRIPKLFRDLARFFLVMVGTAIVLSATWEIDLAGLITALGVGSIVLGLALQDTLGSIVSGIALLFERPFNVGDWLKVGDAVGKVTDINWRAVRLETIDHYQINIPHLIIGKGTITNYSEPTRAHEEEVLLRFSFSHPPNLVKQVLKATALSTPGVLADPKVEVETAAYEDFGISYRVTFYIEDYQHRDRIRDEFQTRVWYANQRYNLRIPFPIREIYQPENPETQADQNSTKVTRSLESIPVLIRMEPDSIEDLAKGAILHNFATGEEVIGEGDPVKALHLILAGKASVTVKTESGQSQEIFSLSRGDFFGEMALFTGQSSTVSIRAIEDLEVILIYSDIATMLIERKPSLAREIGQIMEARSKVINSVKRETGNGKSTP